MVVLISMSVKNRAFTCAMTTLSVLILMELIGASAERDMLGPAEVVLVNII